MTDPFSTKHCPKELLGIHMFTMGASFRAYTELYKLAVSLAPNNTWAEFGVGNGRSSRDLSKLLDGDGKFFLFDSWKGIPEPWDLGFGICEHAGRWKFPKLKTSDMRMVVVDGWFNESLPYVFPGQLGLVHIDCDLYSSTRDVLNGCDGYILPGTVLLFDELIGYTNYKEHEYKALNEWLESTGYHMDWKGKERFAAVGVVTD